MQTSPNSSHPRTLEDTRTPASIPGSRTLGYLRTMVVTVLIGVCIWGALVWILF